MAGNFAQLTFTRSGVVNYNVSGFTEGSRGGGQPLVNGIAPGQHYNRRAWTLRDGKISGISMLPKRRCHSRVSYTTQCGPGYGNSQGAIVNYQFQVRDKRVSRVMFSSSSQRQAGCTPGSERDSPPRPTSLKRFWRRLGVLSSAISCSCFGDYQGWPRGNGLPHLSTFSNGFGGSGDLSSLRKQLFNPFRQTGTVRWRSPAIRRNPNSASMINPVAAISFTSGVYPLPLPGARWQ